MSELLNPQADLHIHSVFSDSDESLEAIFRHAQERKLKCISLTDHDTVDGIMSARQVAKKYNIELLEGIELSSQQQDIEVHILGYCIDLNNRTLQNALSLLRRERHERMIIMIERLQALGLSVDKEEMLSSVEGMVPTRLHLGLYLLKKGIEKTISEVFKKYLSPGSPCYVGCFTFSVKEAIQIIKDSGGLAFLAHPHLLPNVQWIEDFVSYGIDGIEVVYPYFTEERVEYYSKIAEKYGLLKSGGSDAHGSYKKFTSVGHVTVPYSWVEAIKDRRQYVSVTDEESLEIR